MERLDYSNQHINSEGFFKGTQVQNSFPALYDINIQHNQAGNEITLSYPVSDGNAILLLAGADGQVAGMQLLPAGTTASSIDTGKLCSGSYFLVIQSNKDRRIVAFTK